MKVKEVEQFSFDDKKGGIMDAFRFWLGEDGLYPVRFILSVKKAEGVLLCRGPVNHSVEMVWSQEIDIDAQASCTRRGGVSGIIADILFEGVVF